jgi:hypothetical protein
MSDLDDARNGGAPPAAAPPPSVSVSP